jgi:hypothetical protein
VSDAGADGPVAGAGTLPARWFHLVGTDRQGPVPLAAMRELVLEGSIGPDTWVWADGMPDWRHVRDVPALVPPAALRATLPSWPDPATEA